MSVVIRGVKNTFRSGLRTSAFAVILAVSIGLAFSMLLANRAMEDRINSLRQKIGNIIIVNPAGMQGSQGLGKPLTETDIDKVRHLQHVTRVDLAFSVGITTKNKSEKSSNSHSVGEGEPILTSLSPAMSWQDIDPKAPTNLPPPIITADGLSGNRNADAKPIKLIKGRQLKASDGNTALLGKAVAAKNNLTLNDTFTIADKTFTVVGIFDNDSLFANSAIKIPLKIAQSLGKATGQVQAAVIQVDSIDQLENAQAAIRTALGKDRADVTTTQPNALLLVNSLRSVQNVSFIALVVALGAAGLTVFLTMLIVVRERTKEIGVLKALGAGNGKIMVQFITEAVVLTLVGMVLGLGMAALSSNAILRGLLATKLSDGGTDTLQGAGGASNAAITAPQSVHDLATNISTIIDYHVLLYGLLIAIGIAIIGSALPTWLVTRIRPAEVMRGNQ